MLNVPQPVTGRVQWVFRATSEKRKLGGENERG